MRGEKNGMKREPTGCYSFFLEAQVLTPSKRLILGIRGNLNAVDLKTRLPSLSVCGDRVQRLEHAKRKDASVCEVNGIGSVSMIGEGSGNETREEHLPTDEKGKKEISDRTVQNTIANQLPHGH